MRIFITVWGAGDTPHWVGDLLIACLVASPVVVGLTWRLVDHLLARRRARLVGTALDD